MIANEKEISVALYGSYARGDNDIYSDKDILLVQNDFTNRKDIENDFKSKGWSCSVYTYKRMQILSDIKSLFLQHLKQDSIILYDNENNLKKILDSYSPKSDYSKELNDSIEFFDILQHVPDSQLGIGWALDIISLGLKNYGILKAANEGKYIFSLVGLLNWFEEKKIITEYENAVLKETRVYKRNYRHKNYDSLPSKDIFIEAKAILNTKFKLDIPGILLQPEAFKDLSFRELYNPTKYTSYQKIRLLEAFAFVSGANCENLQAISDIIENPKFYTYSFNNQEYINELLFAITANEQLKLKTL